MNAKKENAYMIGDTCLDLIAAKEAGIFGIGVKWEYEDIKKLKSCGEIIKQDVLEAVNFIEQK
jgi:phosphoglycolate phosphatase